MATVWRKGASLVWLLGPVLSASGAIVTGGAAHWTTIAAVAPDGRSFAPTYAELTADGAGTGMYTATITPAAGWGMWWLHARYSDGLNPDQDFADGVIVHGVDFTP